MVQKQASGDGIAGLKPKKREGIVTFQLIPNEKVVSDTSYGTPSKIVSDDQDNLVHKTTESMVTSCWSKGRFEPRLTSHAKRRKKRPKCMHLHILNSRFSRSFECYKVIAVMQD